MLFQFTATTRSAIIPLYACVGEHRIWTPRLARPGREGPSKARNRGMRVDAEATPLAPRPDLAQHDLA
jgi:hypothetical protein